MRFMVTVQIPVEAGNVAARAGKLGETIQSILAEMKPEAVYFTDDHGQRTGFIIVDMKDASQIPAIAEPWFLAFNAAIEIHPVMTRRTSRRRDPRSSGRSRRTGARRTRLPDAGSVRAPAACATSMVRSGSWRTETEPAAALTLG
jgi:hypothetical protein